MENFDDIRPYRDEEIPAAMQRIAADPYFPLLASYVYPGEDVDDVRRRLTAFTNIDDFQLDVMKALNEQVIARTTDGLTHEGFDRLDRSGAYLYVSNHRDIVLDACLLNYVIVVHNGFPTSEITFGANLMMNPLVIDIGKSNRMFRVERPGGSIKDFYRSSLRLSDYIRHVVTHDRRSVWIAQRNGRTKDGHDATDQGIIKMFGMSRRKQPVEALAELNIVPVAVSYEWESCDVLKAKELCASRRGPYVKQPGEDLKSILTGIMQHKGRVHVAACEPLRREELAAAAEGSDGDYHRAVAALIDGRIHRAYRLFPNNYIAADILIGAADFAAHYTAEERQRFEAHCEQGIAAAGVSDADAPTVRDILLHIYANPVFSREQAERKAE